jgi:hypothetical protein
VWGLADLNKVNQPIQNGTGSLGFDGYGFFYYFVSVVAINSVSIEQVDYFVVWVWVIRSAEFSVVMADNCMIRFNGEHCVVGNIFSAAMMWDF